MSNTQHIAHAPRIWKPMQHLSTADELRLHVEEQEWERLSSPHSPIVFLQRRLGAAVLHVHCTDAEGTVLYDQLLLAELLGAMGLAVDNHGRVGLICNFRPQTNAQDTWVADFPDHIDLSAIGRYSLEASGGFGGPGESGEHVMRREAETEYGYKVSDVHYLGQHCDNPAHTVHFMHMYAIELDLHSPVSERDEMEPLTGGIQWYTQKDVADLVRTGSLYDCRTLALMHLTRLLRPGMLR